MFKSKSTIIMNIVIMTLAISFGLWFSDLAFEKGVSYFERGVESFGIGHSSFIESVAEFDNIYSVGDYGETSKEATLFQVGTAFNNIHEVIDWYEFVVVDTSKKKPYLMSTEEVDWEENYLYTRFSFLDEIVESLKKYSQGQEYIVDSDLRTYLVDYRMIDSLQVGLITYIDMTSYLNLEVITKTITVLAIILLYILARILVKIIYQSKIDELQSSNKDLMKIYEFKNHGIWIYDLKTDRFDITYSFMESLGYTEDQIKEINTMDSYYSLLHFGDKKRMEFQINDLLFNKIETVDMTYRLKKSDGSYVLIHTECYSDNYDKEGFSSEIKGINIIIETNNVIIEGD